MCVCACVEERKCVCVCVCVCRVCEYIYLNSLCCSYGVDEMQCVLVAET